MATERFIQQAEDALNEKQYEQAISSADEAIKLNYKKYKPYLQKSLAYLRLGKHDESLKSADSGVAYANESGRREAIGEGQLRRGLAYYQLGKYAEAKFCLNLAKEYDQKKNAKTVEMWLLKVKAKLTDSEQYIDKIPPLPEKPVDAIEPQTTTNDGEGKSNTDETSTSSNEQPKKQSTSIPEFSKPIAPKVAKLDPENVRNDYFQSATAYNVSLFLKGIPKETCNVQFEPTLVKIHCKQPADGSDFDYTLGPLFDDIVPGECSFKVFGTKLELTLKKANNETWKTLLSEEKPTNEDSLEAVRAALGKSKQADSGVQGILQSRKNWDKLAEDMLVANNDEKDDDPNAFFKALYNDADDDTRRAMMKSYIESNGTALSTNWNEVKQKKIDTSPPTGMEAKTWN